MAHETGSSRSSGGHRHSHRHRHHRCHGELGRALVNPEKGIPQTHVRTYGPGDRRKGEKRVKGASRAPQGSEDTNSPAGNPLVGRIVPCLDTVPAACCVRACAYLTDLRPTYLPPTWTLWEKHWEVIPLRRILQLHIEITRWKGS